MTHRTQLSQAEEALDQVTAEELVTTATCPTCHAPAGSRCITRAGKPAREPHGRRFEALEQAAGITAHRAAARREAEARGGWVAALDRKAEGALLTEYAARLRPSAQPDADSIAPTAPTPATEPSQNATPARRQLNHALTALAATTPGRRRYIAEAAQEYLDQIDGRRLPLGYDRPFPAWDGARNRSDAYRMRRGCTVAAMLGLAIQSHDEHFPTTARAIITAVNAPIDRLVEAAHTTGAPAAVALAHILGGAR
ncbi:hypothetical protein J7F03_20705 [Streptomyces sp. ISL-43]|uniref:zinc finger domain-containing protein n=1 Tax=Streptomyces sp. ISL-43 TaxID=2819183 RepID=UPI001BE89A57|nr:hypothetical protein [Streptomyces sp. ISL-43]MBT2449464.1 hypothetical protein [Streptomyces sp. ISL-43]